MARTLQAPHQVALHEFRLKKSAQECFLILRESFKDARPSKATVKRWYCQFRKEKSEWGQSKGSGRPAIAVTDANIKSVDRLVSKNPGITCREIEHRLGIGSGAVLTILHQKLHFRKVCARWVPHSVTADQRKARRVFASDMVKKFSTDPERQLRNIITGDETWAYYYDPLTKLQSMEWVKPNQHRPEKVRRPRSVKKTMLIIFFDCSEIVCRTKFVPVVGSKSVNGLFYRKFCQGKLVKAIHKKRPKIGTRGILLHHDNASPHTARQTLDFFKEKNLRLLPHPPYSPDLVPCDFWLFPKLKEKLKGRTFTTEKELDRAISQALKCLSGNGFFHVFQHWLDRCKKCLEYEGGYFEGQR